MPDVADRQPSGPGCVAFSHSLGHKVESQHALLEDSVCASPGVPRMRALDEPALSTGVVTVSRKPTCRARPGGTVCQGRKGNNTVRRAFDKCRVRQRSGGVAAVVALVCPGPVCPHITHNLRVWRAVSRVSNDLATSRADARKRSTTGVNVRFFSVAMTTGHG